MTQWRENAELRAISFAKAGDRTLTRLLGGGYDGTVFETAEITAIKSFRYVELFERERDVYLRLWELGIGEVCDCRVPRLIDFSNTHWCVEMEIVQPPYVLDFAGAVFDQKPEYPADVIEQWQAEKM